MLSVRLVFEYIFLSCLLRSLQDGASMHRNMQHKARTFKANYFLPTNYSVSSRQHIQCTSCRFKTPYTKNTTKPEL